MAVDTRFTFCLLVVGAAISIAYAQKDDSIHNKRSALGGTMRFGKRAAVLYSLSDQDVDGLDDEQLLRQSRSALGGTMRFGKRAVLAALPAGDSFDDEGSAWYAKRSPLGTMRFGRRR